MNSRLQWKSYISSVITEANISNSSNWGSISIDEKLQDMQCHIPMKSMFPFQNSYTHQMWICQLKKPYQILGSWLVRADLGLVDNLEEPPCVCASMEQLKQKKKHWNEPRTGKSTIPVNYTDCQSGSHQWREMCK